MLADGTIEGFVGGACTEHSVRAYALLALRSGEPVLLRVLPEVPDRAGVEPAVEGAVTVQNPCLSGGAIEVFLEPSSRFRACRSWARRRSRTRCGGSLPELGLEPVESGAELALVVAAHGRDELGRAARRAGGRPARTSASWPARAAAPACSRSCAPTASRRRCSRAMDVPAGLAIGARSPAEVALSILAKVVAGATQPRRRRRRRLSVDPICGMTVAVGAGTPSVRHGGGTVHFCGEGCKASFEEAHQAHARSPTDPVTCGLVLGAGGSTRLGRPKQLLPFGDGTLLGHVVDVARTCAFDQLVVALGGAAKAVRATVDLAGADVVVNDAYGAGCSSSIAAALEVVDPRCDVLVLLLGDQPGVTADTVAALLTGRGTEPLAVCRYADGRGHPIAFARSVFPALAALHGDKGVWRLLDRSADEVVEVSVAGPIPLDVDTPEDYRAVLAR